MKTKSSLVFFPAVLMFFPLGLANAQSVVIEGGPDSVQISDRDGKPEAITPQRATGPNAVTRDGQNIPRGPEQPRIPAANRPLTPAPATGRVMGPAGPAGTPVTIPELAAPPRSLAAGEAMRISELKRELGILDTGTNAAFSLNTENVFSKGAATVDPIAEGKLSLIAEYMQLALAREIRLTYHFSPSLHDKDLAWARSVAMIKWMTEKGGLAESSFTIQNPSVVTEAAPTTVPDDGNLTALQNRIEFNVLFR